MKRSLSLSRLLPGVIICLTLFCKQHPRDSDMNSAPAKEKGTLSSDHVNQIRDLQEALRAFALDSADTKILYTWGALRKASPSRNGGTFANWLKENYWPLQSIGLRLIEQAQLELERNRQTAARAKLDSVAQIADDLAGILHDAVLQSYLRKIQDLNNDERHARTAIIFSILQGRAQTRQQDYAAALNTLQQAQQAAWQLGDSLTAAEIGIAFLDVYSAKEDYARAVQEGESCAALAAKIGYHWIQAQALNQRAEAERILGHDERALSANAQALEIAVRLGDRRTQRDCHLYRGRIFYDQEKYREAGLALQEVSALDVEREYLGDILLLQGQMHLDRGEYGLAKEYLERAVGEFEKNHKAGDVATAYSSLSLLHMEQGDEQNALQAERAALKVHQQENNARRMGWSHMNLGLIYAQFDSVAPAEAAVTRAIAQMRQSDEPRALAQALVVHGNLQLQQKNFSRAAGTFAEALTWAQKVNFQYGQAGVFIGQARLALAETVTAAADSHLTAAEKIARALHEPHLLTQILFRRALLEKQKLHAAAALGFLEQAIATMEQRFHSITRDSSRMQFFAPAQEIFDEAILLSLAAGQSERALHFSERARARALLESIGAAAQERDLASLPAIPNVSQIQQILPEKNHIIIYRVTADTLVAWVLGKSTFISRKLALAQAALADSVQKFRESIGAVDVAGFSNRVAQNPMAVYRENRRLGRGLFRMLLEPLQHDLQECETIYLIPDGALHQIPFGALVTPQDRFLEEECVLVKAPSLSLLYQGWRSPRQIAKIAGNRMVIVSNPAGDFPAANEEKTLLADLFPRHQILQRERASYAAIEEQLHNGAEILHLSLHAFADPLRPLNSYIELSAPAATAAHPQTERVFARQLLGLKLPGVWLTFLNGCETASGRIVHGEGALSLVRLFALQRVAVVIATLWKNDDWQSLPIVAGFYHELQRGADPATALHRAKIAALTELSAHSQERIALPYFWAVFEIYFNQRVHAPV